MEPLLQSPLPPKITQLDMDKICRVCMCNDSHSELMLLFDEKYSAEVGVAIMLTQCTKYKVDRFDKLPQLICAACLDAVRQAYRFKQLCEQSYRTMFDMLSKTQSPSSPPPPHRVIKMEEAPHAATEKSTQTDDSSLYLCERCDEKYFTFDALREHRENEHKGSAIVCRFCSKTFNRIGYLKTHCAVFHPESGYTSHNQCRICRRQFTRREHMRRHLAVIHKIVEIVDESEQARNQTAEEVEDEKNEVLLEEEEQQLTEIENSEFFEEVLALSPDDNKNSRRVLEAHNKEPLIPTETNESEEEDGISNTNEETRSPDAPMSNDEDDEDDEKPLSNYVNSTTTKGFVEVLLNENSANVDYDNPEEKLLNREHSASPQTFKSIPDNEIEVDAEEDVLQSVVVKRGRGRPRRIHKEPAATTFTYDNDDNADHKCTTCDKVFQNRIMLQRHILKHKTTTATDDGKRQFPCKICAKCFTSAELHKCHMRSAHGAARLMQCDECDQEFTHTSQYKRHKETKHSDRVHKCDECAKCFTTKIYLQRHALSHGKKRYICKECSQTYCSKEELAAHIKAAGHDKPMLCPECGLRCKTSNILMVHMRRHNGEKPFKCKFCSKGFPRMDDLRVHEKYHTGEKSHFCETCGKGFQRKYNLTIHLRVHTGEKPYKCPHCPQAFAQGNDLKAHIRRHTGERFRCEVCGAAFLQGYQIRNHKFMEHGIKEHPPTQRVAKFTSPEEQEQQIKQNLQKALTDEIVNDHNSALGVQPPHNDVAKIVKIEEFMSI